MSTSSAIKRALVGRPIATADEGQERLSKKLALPVFSADAISSTAYATEEILLALMLAGSMALRYSIYVSLAVAGLLAIVALSYQQTVHAYPSGGGSYIVSRENLGLTPGLIAAASLMIDYVMTVAVSTAAGVAAVYSAVPSLYNYRVYICIGVILLVALANLRGVRESGTLFAVPTYLFVLLCGGLVVVGIVRWALGDLPPILHDAPIKATQDLTIFLILRAFAGGVLGHDRHRGDFKRRSRLQTAGEPERWDDTRHHGRSPSLPIDRSDSAFADPPRLPHGKRERHGPQPGGEVGVRPWHHPLLRATDSDHGHPLLGGEYELRGFPAAFFRAGA